MWTVGGDEMERDPETRPRQPGLNQFGMMVRGVVKKDVDLNRGSL
jgi:hypothetical protein